MMYRSNASFKKEYRCPIIIPRWDFPHCKFSSRVAEARHIYMFQTTTSKLLTKYYIENSVGDNTITALEINQLVSSNTMEGLKIEPSNRIIVE